VTTPLTTVSVQLAALAQSIVSEFGLRVVPVAAVSPVLRLALKVPATVALVTTFIVWVTSQPAVVVSATTVGGGMIVGV
jgi:hypothetical protein